jgi:hypothetical protein
LFEGPHLAAVADRTHAAFPLLDIRTVSKGVEFEMAQGFYYRMMPTLGIWLFDWTRPGSAGLYDTSPPHPVARRGEDPEWAVVNAQKSLSSQAVLARLAIPSGNSQARPTAKQID